MLYDLLCLFLAVRTHVTISRCTNRTPVSVSRRTNSCDCPALCETVTPVPSPVGVPPGVAVRTNKPVSVNRAQDGLQTGDRNTDRKFAFISSAARPDYRPQQVRQGSTQVTSGHLPARLPAPAGQAGVTTGHLRSPPGPSRTVRGQHRSLTSQLRLEGNTDNQITEHVSSSEARW